MAASKIGKVLARGLGIDPDEATRTIPEHLVQRSAKAIEPFELFVEELPTTREWILNQGTTRQGVISYLASLFPFISWIRRYNLRWLLADLIAGFTLALVVIPQGLSYALLADLTPEYGLYTSFTGASLYLLFGTSKDIAVGATAVVSLLVGKTGTNVIENNPQFTQEQISKTHAFLSGCIFLLLGLSRLGWIIELIPHVATSAFVTAAAITIILGQVPTLLGINDINTRSPAYRVFIDTCKGLGRTKLDAAIGLTAFALLTFLKWLCEYMTTGRPRQQKISEGNQVVGRKKKQEKIWATVSSLRFIFVVALYILISYLVNRNIPFKEFAFRILGEIPVGFGHNGPPTLKLDLINALLPELPATVIIIIIEHIAIGKAFGRKNGYTIVPSQELVAIAATNMVGPFIGGYASTASFGGSAVFSKAGVRTPLGGIFNASVLLLTMYVLHPVLYWIPKASLAALIIHAVINLIEPPSHVFKSWLISPPDVIIYFVGVLTSIFSSLENGIYATIALSAGLLLMRLARARGRFLGRARVYRFPHGRKKGVRATSSTSSLPTPALQKKTKLPARDVFFPLHREDASNPSIYIESPRAGVFIYRFPDGFNYVNQAQHMDSLLAYITKLTRRTETLHYEHPGDRPWNEPTPVKTQESSGSGESEASKPTLKSLILDFSAVNSTDTGAIDGLVELRAQLLRWAAPDPVQWHFASVEDRWVRRALVAAGFGYPRKEEFKDGQHWDPIFTFAERQRPRNNGDSPSAESSTVLTGVNTEAPLPDTRRLAATHGINYPNFHVDLATAVEAVVGFATPDGSGSIPPRQE
ncbi:sulfate permease II [Jackrogersella minutella]|nr:sulfate permease II [Jackrogersella minutella]